MSSFREEHLLTILGDVEKLLKPRLNVLLLSDVTTSASVLRHLGHSAKARLWTLMFYPNGRNFTHVALSSEAVINPMDVFPNVKFGYNGRQLTAVMKENNYGYSYMKVNERRVFGFSFRILELLAEAMNFSYRVIPPREDEWGQNINGSWTGVFGMLQRREADLASDILTIHSDRTAVADYLLPPIAETKQVIMYKKEEDVDKDHLLIFLRPFRPYVFMIFGVSLITCIIFLSSIRLIHNKDQFNFNKCQTRAWTMQATTTTFEILGASLKQGSTIRSSRDSERVLVTGWWMLTTVISAVYCGTIMAIFAVKIENPPFSNMAELAARDDYKIGYDSTSITENLFQNSRRSDVMAIKQRVQGLSTRDPDIFSSNDTKHLQKVWDGKYAYISGLLLTAISNVNCKLKVIDTKFGRAFLAFYLPKTSPFRQDFQKSMYHLSDSGILQRTFQEWFPSSADDGCQVEDFPKSMSLVKIQSIFFVVGVGLVCSSMILVTEIVWYKTKHTMADHRAHQ
ncbi:glutamate receptor ionotropic, kainate 5-like [Haliotis cracherodii]|uniref:glutamate receptor ionotropic, kainate 5-like n=1 Tax=Haliotis cracherodii TaxID=6455 RepID=UPI0039E755DA